jgi:arylsulfatase A-like enzyme
MASRLSIILFFSIILLSCFSDHDLNENDPNILVLVADDAGYRDFGCYGNGTISTPNIDRLSKEGLRFNNAFLTISQCSPSRISILSGLYPHQTGAEDLHMPLPDNIKLLPSYLKAKNYYTGMLRKSHLGPNGEKQFDFYSNNLNDFNDFLDSAKSNPFFIWVGFVDPHRPYSKDIIENPQDPEKVYVPPYLVDNSETRDDLADYCNEIMRMDSKIGEYVKSLKERKFYENTLIIFFSDNGAPFPREKGTVYDAGVKTPLIFTWKDEIKKTGVFEGLTSLIDLTPTLLDIAGIKIPDNLSGESMLEILKDQSLPGREYIFAERNWHNCDEHIRMVRSKNYKLISNAYTESPFGSPADISNSPSWLSLYQLKQKKELSAAQELLFQVPRPEYEFYDLRNDPMELNNLIDSGKYKTEIKRLKMVLEGWRTTTNDFSPQERRRKDNTDRITGVKFDNTRLPERKEH